ncbi:MAG: CheY-like chemotaxis protein/anti-sigma regulatory factor (Ser/Thr protein kinase) [Alteromonadaceae bacterium]|jgi:CheY-like chemotaxis protein/anti-sigma regulatory factor (Ser/Thr protein kinase)
MNLDEDRGQEKRPFEILIVDDNPVNIDLLRCYLSTQGYSISAVTSGDKALKLIDRVKPDLILLDVMMPDIDGYETCRRLKSNRDTETIPVIFVTAKTEPEDIHQGFEAGGSDYITKPAQQDEVLARVANQIKLLERAKFERELVYNSAKMAELGSFVGSIAHEVSTPLGTLNTALSFTIDQARALQNAFEEKTLKPAMLKAFLAQVNEALQISQTNIDSASRILHSFKLIAVDQCRYAVMPFNLREYGDNIILSLKPKLKSTNHQVILQIPADIEINSYPGAISQIITNLINNSLLHGYAPGLYGNLSINAQEQTGRTEIIYSDDGQGMSKQTLEQIFVPYYTTKGGKGGSGLGMGIIKKLVEQDLRGSVDISSNIGEGVKVTINFPSTHPSQRHKKHQPTHE